MTDKSDIFIDIQDVSKKFGKADCSGRCVFFGKKGEAQQLLWGQAVAGKTTLLSLLVGINRPNSGNILYEGRDIAKFEEEDWVDLKKRFGILFQSGALFNSMTVGENVALPLVEHTSLDPNTINIIVKMKLEQVGLRGFEDLLPSQISGGMKKRVGLARAIALDPELVFYDEPSAGLDPIVSGVIDQLIMDFSSKLGITSVVVTHDMNSAFKIADQIVMLYKGIAIAQGTAEEIKNSDDPRVLQFIHGSPDGPIPLRQSKGDYLRDLLGELE